MALARARRSFRTVDYWPGFVDALSTMLLMFTFLLSVFVLAQFFLSRDVTGKDTALQRLNRQIEELTSLLALERSAKSDAQASLSSLTVTLEQTRKDKAELQNLLDQSNAGLSGAGSQAAQANKALDAEKQVSARALAQIDILNQQIAALRRQLSAIEDALAASESRDRESQAKIADLGSRLNVALAQKVQELARYRSDFFGRLRQILGNRTDVRIVGDRFVFQSELFFERGQAVLKAEAMPELDRIAALLVELEKQIPPDIPWVLRVDGHTDVRPIATLQFPSNWALSASRAIAVVQYLIQKGIPPQRLVAAGFGEFQPLHPATTDEAYARNRRI